MIDHLGIVVTDFERSVAFYKAALAPLGYEVMMTFPDTVGMGAKGMPDLWISKAQGPAGHVHIALRAERDQIDAFHAAALAAGGTDNGAPGLRPHYHPHYYAAFVQDPDGHNIEAVSHGPPSPPAASAKPKSATKAKSAKAKSAKAKSAKAKPAKAKPAKAKPAAKAKPSKKPAPKSKRR